MKKLRGFSYSKNMANFEAFHWNIPSSTKFIFPKSVNSSVLYGWFMKAAKIIHSKYANSNFKDQKRIYIHLRSCIFKKIFPIIKVESYHKFSHKFILCKCGQ